MVMSDERQAAEGVFEADREFRSCEARRAALLLEFLAAQLRR